MKKDQNLPKKKIHSKNSSENHSQTIIISIDNNHPTEKKTTKIVATLYSKPRATTLT